jgi:hypothetical protein
MADIETPALGTTSAGAGIDTEQAHVLDTRPSTEPQDWRDLIKVHPAADKFPPMSDDELDTLGKDILQHGLRVRLVFHGDELIDGRNRITAVWRTFGQRRRERFMRRVLDREKDCCAVLPDGTDPLALVVSANIHRRHLAPEMRDEIIAELIKSKPERSDRQTARLAGVSHPKVAKVRRQLEEAGDVEKVSTRTDSAGRQQPARKLSRHARAIPCDRLEEIDQLADQKDALRVLEEAIRFLTQRRTEILATPWPVRLARAMAIIDALGLGIDDLVPESRADEARG